MIEVMINMSEERQQSATLRVLDADPEMAWREAMMAKMDDVQRDLRKVDALITDVRELRRIAEACFKQLLEFGIQQREDEKRITALEDDVRVLKAQVKDLLSSRG